ncbi:rRNA-processing protein efg1 isoform X3 [Canna indica]|uniref:rRNA-processing protein EFG1 n=1 Tax=Canna indica TaxID=4628 RepID=A0AAQ3JLC5_9LILI|nr:rRNA-processing protein efg1 isoform X3 [Canna indica]
MAHGGISRRRHEEQRPLGRQSKGLEPQKNGKKSKNVSLKNQIRSTERLLRKDLPIEVKQAQEKKLEELKKQQDAQMRLALEQKMRLKDKRIKFFERIKIERMIRQLEKQQCASSDHASNEETSDQLSKLREDLNYVKFFPKNERYVSLFVGGDNANIVDKRNKLRALIKANLIEAAANGKDLEETASDDGALDVGEDDFFLSGGSSDEAEADRKWTDKSTREPTPSASGKAASRMSSDKRNQQQMSARELMPPAGQLPSNKKDLMPPPGQLPSNRKDLMPPPGRLPSNRNQLVGNVQMPTSSKTSNSRNGPSSKSLRSVTPVRGQNSNLSSTSDTYKPRRKRRPKKKKQE